MILSVRSFFIFTLSTTFLFLLSACSSVEESTSAPGASLIALQAKFDKTVYQPGEMAVATICILNVADKPVVLRAPQCQRLLRDSNLHFRVRRLGGEEIRRRMPILIHGDLVAPTVRLEPAEVIEEKYGFVNLTETTGTFKVFVEYTGIPVDEAAFREGKIGRSSLVSSLTSFKVAGPIALRRGSGGLITKQESIRLAKAAWGQPVAEARAVLKETSSELLDWWVTLRIAPDALKPGAPDRIAYYVSATGGFVRQRAEPFALDSAESEKPKSPLSPNPK